MVRLRDPLPVGLPLGLPGGLVVGLAVGLMVGLAVGLVVALFACVSSPVLESSESPAQSIISTGSFISLSWFCHALNAKAGRLLFFCL